MKYEAPMGFIQEENLENDNQANLNDDLNGRIKKSKF